MIKHFTTLISIRYVLTIFTAMTLFIAGTGLSPATAATPEKETVTTTVENTTVISETDTGAVGLTLPGQLVDQPQVSLAEVPEEYLDATEATPIASTKLPHSAISSYETDDGTQTLIRIDSDKAAKEYRFPLSLPAGATAELVENGSILIKNADNEALGGYDVPWAVDANGVNVPTRFTLNGDTLIQTVDFTEQTAFPVVADPIWFAPWVIRCLTGVGVNIDTVYRIALRGTVSAALAAGGYAAVRCVLGR